MNFLEHGTKIGSIVILASIILPGCNRGETSTEFVPRKNVRRNLAPTPQVTWRPSNKTETATARGVVQKQLRAFRSDDYQTAFDLMATEMRGGTAKPDRLRALITGNYPEFAQVTRIRWINNNTGSDGALTVRLRFRARNGNVVGATYMLRRKDAGTYLISGIFSQPMGFRRRNYTPSLSSENAALQQFFNSPESAS